MRKINHWPNFRTGLVDAEPTITDENTADYLPQDGSLAALYTNLREVGDTVKQALAYCLAMSSGMFSDDIPPSPALDAADVQSALQAEIGDKATIVVLPGRSYR